MSAFQGTVRAGARGWLVLVLAGVWAFAATATGIGAPAAETTDSLPARTLALAGVALELDWYQQRWAFLGAGVRAELRSSSDPVAFILEGAWLREQDGDDEVLRLGGLAVVRFLVESGQSLHLKIGMGWLRWRDTSGRDRGVWDRVYRTFSIGVEVPLASLFSGLAGLHGFVEFNFLPPWFSGVSVGFLLPLSKP